MNTPSVPNYSHIDIRIMRVTPRQAEEWLGLNTANRKVKPRNVAAFAADMKEGRWMLNGATIVFAGTAEKPEKLLDGQNRLLGQVKSGETVDHIVVFGVAIHSQASMDSGAKRTVADNLTIGGASNAVNIGAAAALEIRVREGKLNGGPVPTTNAAVLELIEENPEIATSAELARKYARKADAPPSIVAYTHWVLSKIDADDADDFWADAASKVGLKEGDPVIALTNWFAESRRNKRRLTPGQMLSAVYRAWNYRRAGKTLSIIKSNTSSGSVSIPEPK